MDSQSKDDAAKATSIRLTKRMKSVAWMTVACALLPCGWLKRLIVRPRTRGELQAPDKAINPLFAGDCAG